MLNVSYDWNDKTKINIGTKDTCNILDHTGVHNALHICNEFWFHFHTCKLIHKQMVGWFNSIFTTIQVIHAFKVKLYCKNI